MISHELSEAARSMRRLQARLRRNRRRQLGINHSRRVELPELDGLELPPWMDGDRLHERVDRLWSYYLPDGRPVSGADTHEVLMTWARIRAARGSHHQTLFYRGGVPIQVSTVYLGLDQNWSDAGPPIIWETMVFVGDTREDMFCARYATPNAALHGHRVVCDVIRQAQRARRSARRRPQILISQHSEQRA